MKKILVIDDSPTVRQQVGRIITPFKAELLVAAVQRLTA
jgi:CheY-like chemotaxis protein